MTKTPTVIEYTNSKPDSTGKSKPQRPIPSGAQAFLDSRNMEGSTSQSTSMQPITNAPGSVECYVPKNGEGIYRWGF